MSNAATGTRSLHMYQQRLANNQRGGSLVVDEEKRVVDRTTYQETNESALRSMISLFR